jgi:hypothetical protein
MATETFNIASTTSTTSTATTAFTAPTAFTATTATTATTASTATTAFTAPTASTATTASTAPTAFTATTATTAFTAPCSKTAVVAAAFKDLITLPSDADDEVFVARILGLGATLQDLPPRKVAPPSTLEASGFLGGVPPDVAGKFGPNMLKHRETWEHDNVRNALLSVYDTLKGPPLRGPTFDTIDGLQGAISTALAPYNAILLTDDGYWSQSAPTWGPKACELIGAHINFIGRKFLQAACLCPLRDCDVVYDTSHGVMFQYSGPSDTTSDAVAPNVTSNLYITMWFHVKDDGSLAFFKFGTGYAKERVTKTPPSIFTEAYKVVRDGVMPDVNFLKNIVKAAAADFGADGNVWALAV